MDLIADLSEAEDLPLEAMRAALRNPGRIAGGVLRVVAAAAEGAALGPRDQNLLFWGLHVLGQAGDTRLFRPFLGLLARPQDDLDAALGEVGLELVPNILVGTFDGEAGPLVETIARRESDSFVRWKLFGALAYLTFAGRISHKTTRAFLVRFEDERLAAGGDESWNGWAETVALLGLADLRGRVEAAWADGRLLDDVTSPDWFDATLSEALASPADPARFAALGLGPLDDAVAALEHVLEPADDEETEPGEPIRNPLREVGRNDPCPCGSGLKFKKCCLPAA